jgi:hypothetical protein
MPSIHGNQKHGMSQTAEYAIWSSMNSRCHNPKSTNFKNYGKRGITVYTPWRKSLAQFLRDIGPRPSEFHSLDRIDNNGPYSPENCRWATRKEQQRNRRNSVLVTIQGQTLPLLDWAEKLGFTGPELTLHIKRGTPDEIILAGIKPPRMKRGRKPTK